MAAVELLTPDSPAVPPEEQPYDYDQILYAANDFSLGAGSATDVMEEEIQEQMSGEDRNTMSGVTELDEFERYAEESSNDHLHPELEEDIEEALREQDDAQKVRSDAGPQGFGTSGTARKTPHPAAATAAAAAAATRASQTVLARRQAPSPATRTAWPGTLTIMLF